MTDIPVPWSSFWPFAGLAPVCSCLSHTGESRIGYHTPDGSHQCWGVALPLLTCWWYSYQWLPLLWGHIIGSWSTWHPPGCPNPFVQSCFPACWSPAWCMGILLPMSRTWHFPLVKIHEIPVCSFLQIVKVPLSDGTTTSSINCFFQFCIICKIRRWHTQLQKCSLV